MHRRRGSPVPAYARGHVLETLKWRFAYAFAGNAGYPASVDPIELRDHQSIGPIEVSAIEMPHGPIKASGLIFSDGAHRIAYATDFSKFTVEMRSEEHTSELQSLMRISYAVFCLKKKKNTNTQCQFRN